MTTEINRNNNKKRRKGIRDEKNNKYNIIYNSSDNDASAAI